MSVSRGLKRLTAVALGVVVLAAAGVLAAPYIVPERDARLAAMQALRAATGVEPQIAGAVYLTLLPSPAIRLEEVRLADDKRRPGFAAAAIRANVRLMPLFFGSVEIASLVFEYPHLTIETSEQGAVSLGIPMRRAAAPANVDMPEVRFENGTVQFKGDVGSSVPFTDVAAAVAWSGSGINASGSFRWRGQPSTFSLSVGDLAALERGDRSNFRLRAEGEELKVGFDGGIAYRNGVQADGTLSAETRSLRKTLSQISATTPVMSAGLGIFKLKGHLAVAAHSASLTKLAVELDGNRAEGGLTLQKNGDKTIVQATLATDHADFSPYSSGFLLVDEEGRDWSREPIDLSALGLFDLDMRFSAARVTIRKTELTRVAATATMRNDALTVVVGDARFHGGQLRGRAVVSRTWDDEADVKIEGSVANLDLEPGLTALASIRRLEGKGSLSLALESRGPSIHALTRGLSGNVSLDAAAGALTGINVEQVLRRLERNPIQALPDFGSGRTAFERLNARLSVSGGTARIEDARVESAQVRLQLFGETSVPYRDFNLRGVAALTRATTGTDLPFELPFLVRGAWDSPYLLPDPTGMLRRSGSTDEAAMRSAWLVPDEDTATADIRAE